MKNGEIYNEDFLISQEEVIRFAEITGDKNPIHINPEYADQSIFKRPIIHGFLAGSKFSKVLGMNFPGEGTIYLYQEMKFIKPMYVENFYTLEIKVVEIIELKKRLVIETRIYEKDTGIDVITGKAIVQNPKLTFEL